MEQPVKYLTRRQLIKATNEFRELERRIDTVLDRMIRDEDGDADAHSREYQTEMEILLHKYGESTNSDIRLMGSKIQRKLVKAFANLNEKTLSSLNQFPMKKWKENIRTVMRQNFFKHKRPDHIGMFLYAFPTALLTSGRDKLLMVDHHVINVEAITGIQTAVPRTPRRNYNEEIKHNNAISRAPEAVEEVDGSFGNLLIGIERRIVELEGGNRPKPMLLIKLACDPESFDNTVDNLVRLSFLLQSGALLHFKKDNERMVISRHNTERTGFKIPQSDGIETQFLHYDIATWQNWIEKYDIRENLLRNIQ